MEPDAAGRLPVLAEAYSGYSFFLYFKKVLEMVTLYSKYILTFSLFPKP